ncbi:MAG: phosphate signaling complex protein PhoU [Gammaproteobacteria bacterium]|jgi:phosphate transport system protein
MSHYEERLERDLARIRERVAEMAGLVENGIKNAVHALQTGNQKLAAETILADHPINRTMREIDRLCHGFIALHLPSAGHLRLLSSVIRANIELERIGDYAVTIARETIQLSAPPSGPMARELERVGSETRLMLRQAIKAFRELNADMARTTMLMEEQMENDLDIVYAELMANEDREGVKNLLAIFAVFNQLKRVADQAKNLCEETVFAATGDTKAPKIYHVLFVDEDNSCLSQMAEAIARKYFPGSGVYTSAGRQPAASLHTAMTGFLEQHGIHLGDARPKALDMTPLELTTQHVIVSLQGPVKTYFEQVPFHTTPLEWDIEPAPATDDTQQANKQLEAIYREIAVQVRDLMETLRGEGAP